MSTTKEKYIEAVGRRKTSVARVRITPASKESLSINNRTLTDYFPTAELQAIVRQPLLVTEMDGTYSISVMVNGGGIHSQAEAVRHGLARSISTHKTELRVPLKQKKLLTRDPRAKERRKFGLKKARKAPQWSKR
jgi:small subunit ribosomal protein S9